MNSLVSYESSDDDEEIRPLKTAKMAKLESNVPSSRTNALQPSPTGAGDMDLEMLPTSHTLARIAEPTEIRPAAPGPAAVPIVTQLEASHGSRATTPFSPYTYERQRLRELTMPPIPNFGIPESPPPPAPNSEEAAVLAATTKKFERFLELKKQGVHFNERLQKSTSLRNPSLLPKLMEFAGITMEESYASSLSDDVAVAVKWPEAFYVENLMRQNERREKKALAERERVEFVPSFRSATSSTTVTPSSEWGGQRKSRFNKK